MNENTESGNNYVLIITSLVLGIISLFSWHFPIRGITVAGLGLFFGIIGMGYKKRGIPLAVMLICCIGLVLSAINIGLGLDSGTAVRLFPMAGKNTPVFDSFRISPPPGAKLAVNSENSQPELDDLIDSYAAYLGVYPPYDWEAYFVPQNSPFNSVYAYYKKAVSAYDLEYIETKGVGEQGRFYSFANKYHTVKILVKGKTGLLPAGMIVFYDEGSVQIPQSKNIPLPTATKEYTVTAPRIEITTTVQKKQQIEDTSDKCYEWSEISLRDVGTTKCVYGTVIKQRNEPTALYLIFSPESDDFYFISYGNWYYNDVEGNCAMAYGEIRQLGEAPVMVIDNRMLRYCE